MHVTKQAISKWEKGKSVPDISSVELLSAFFGVSVDYLINDSIEADKSETQVVSPKRLNKLNVVLISILALMFAAIVALSVTVGVLLNKNKLTGTVEVNGFKITYLSDETEFSGDKYIHLSFNIYNSTDFTKRCVQENFVLDNDLLCISWISNVENPIEAHGESRIYVMITTSNPAENLGEVQRHSVTVKYAGQAIANIKW